MAIDILGLALARSYTDEEVAGGGAIKGKNCVIDSTEAITGGTRVTFKWTLDNGTVQTGYIDVMDGADGQDGATGATGPQGPKGDKGEKGDKGDTGAKGKDGSNVVTVTQVVESGTKIAEIHVDDVTTNIYAPNNYAELENGKVPASELPSFVDDVIDGYYKAADGKFYKESTYETEITGESGKIYISVDTSIQYRWTGSAFSALGGALVLGETSSTAYRGDRGKIAYDDSQANKTAIGTLANLTTETKTSLVDAINEVASSSGGETAVTLTVGNTYSFGGVDWTCAESIEGGYVLQSQGFTASEWPGYKMTGPTTGSGNWGPANTAYNGDIDGADISGLNDTTSIVYSLIKEAELTSASYGKGLYLVNFRKVGGWNYGTFPVIGTTEYNYWYAMKTAAGKKDLYNTTDYVAFIGTHGSEASQAAGVSQSGYVQNTFGQQSDSLIIAPAFNLDANKVTLDGTTIKVKGERDSVYVISDGSKTYQTILYELSQKVDYSKIKPESVLCIGSNIYNNVATDANATNKYARFTQNINSGSSFTSYTLQICTSSANCYTKISSIKRDATQNTFADQSDQVVSSNICFELIY